MRTGVRGVNMAAAIVAKWRGAKYGVKKKKGGISAANLHQTMKAKAAARNGDQSGENILSGIKMIGAQQRMRKSISTSAARGW